MYAVNPVHTFVLTNKQYTSQVNPRLLHVHWEGSYILSKRESSAIQLPQMKAHHMSASHSLFVFINNVNNAIENQTKAY